ncbi:MAG: SRPBCC domain-containing protein [Acetobacteraceae bacterium]|nr:SRPBCC domain-containing protein [Acetobacteraceae bacterium]
MSPVPPVATPIASAVPTPVGPSFTLAIQVARPHGEIWAALHDPALLAACVPGARLMSQQDGVLAGEMQIALGPIVAAFSGSGRLALDEATHRATLSGEGQDRRSNTSLSGVATITLEATTPAVTQVALRVTYALRGPLAQLARGPVVQAFASGIAETVARNLERRLAGDTASVTPSRLSAVGLLRRILWQRLRRWLGLG